MERVHQAEFCRLALTGGPEERIRITRRAREDEPKVRAIIRLAASLERQKNHRPGGGTTERGG